MNLDELVSGTCNVFYRNYNRVRLKQTGNPTTTCGIESDRMFQYLGEKPIAVSNMSPIHTYIAEKINKSTSAPGEFLSELRKIERSLQGIFLFVVL